MKIFNVNIGDITPYVKNAKKHPKEQVKNIAESLKQFGWQQPIVIDKDGVIIIGHGRYEAAKLLKMNEVPVVKAEDLTEEQVRKLRLLDNKLNESDWDFDLLLDELGDLDMTDFDLDWNVDGLGPDVEAVDDNFEVILPEEPKSRAGQIFKLGRHRLMCGDSTSEDDVKKLTGGGGSRHASYRSSLRCVLCW